MKNLILIGAGSAGEHILNEILKNQNNYDYSVIGFLDADPNKHGKKINGYPIIGDHENLEKYIKKFSVDEIIVSTTAIDHDTVDRIYEKAKKYDVDVEVLPSFEEMFLDEPYTKQLRNIQIEDLLGRDANNIHPDNIRNYIKDKKVLVTGAAGSIGSEICKQIAKYEPDHLILLDINENNQYFLKLFLQRHYPDLKIDLEICNIREKNKLDYLFNLYKPDYTFHAAAHKHVPLLEKSIEEAIKNNVFGTKNVIETADKYNVSKFVLISSDKAVNPTNVMGATKRLSELILLNINRRSQTKFMTVRFGNVLGSDGSVIPLFKTLLKEGRDLTVTHKEVKRYFMTIPEAAQLVLEAGYIGDGGEVFVLDMGEPIKIVDMAKRMIELSGLELGKDVNIKITGLRPGEKLYEELLYDINTCKKTENKKIYINGLKDESIDIKNGLKVLKKSVSKLDRDKMRKQLKKLVPTYKENKMKV